MISRQWKGIARINEADRYIKHLKTDTFPTLKKIKGFQSVSILTVKRLNGVEFLIVTEWESIEAIKHFAGDDIEVAVVPEIVQSMMIEYDKTCRHYEIELTTNMK